MFGSFARAPEQRDTPLCLGRGAGCIFPASMVPRVWVPEVGWPTTPGTQARRMFCNLPFCAAHWDADWMRANLLTDRVKAIFEQAARLHGMGKLDFDKTWFEQVDLRDPDYVQFIGLRDAGLHHPALPRVHHA